MKIRSCPEAWSFTTPRPAPKTRQKDSRRLHGTLISVPKRRFRTRYSYPHAKIQAIPRTDRSFNGQAGELTDPIALMCSCPFPGYVPAAGGGHRRWLLETSKHTYVLG